MSARTRPWIFAAVLVASRAAISQPAPAGSPSLVSASATRRRELLETASRLRAEGDHAHALESAIAAAEITMTPSVRMFIAEENVTLGHDVEGWTNARACVDEATAAAELNNRDRILAACNDALAATASHIALVAVQLPNDLPEDFELRIGAVPVPTERLESDVPLAPGHVVMTASATGHLPWRRELELRAGARTVVEVVLVRAAGATPSVAPTPTAALAIALPPAPAGVVTTHGAQPRVAPWILGGVGVAATVAGAVLLGVNLDLTQSLHCQSGVCDRYLVNGDYTTAAATGSAAYVALGAGVAMIGSAALWLFAVRTSASSRPLAAWAVPVSGGLSLGVGGSL